MSKPNEAPWVIVALDNRMFAIHVGQVQEMLRAPNVARVPQTPDWVRGVINLRGEVMPLIDLRRRLGMESSLTEVEGFCALMEQREQDHRRWLDELQASVREHRAFTLATDPHQCAFGKWYDSFEPRNLMISGLLKRFDAPHKAIHGVAARVTQLAAAGRMEHAQEVIADARRGVLKLMTDLFGELRQLIRESNREVAVVLRIGTRLVAVCADSVESIEPLTVGSLESARLNVPGIDSAGKLARDGRLVLTLETEWLLGGWFPNCLAAA